MKKITLFLFALSLICSDIIPVQASKVKLNLSSINVSTTDIFQLKVYGTKKKIKWSSSNPAIARVTQKGVVYPSWFGNATIKAKAGKKTLKCKVHVLTENLWFDRNASHTASIMKISSNRSRIKFRFPGVSSGKVYATGSISHLSFKNAGKYLFSGYVKEYESKCIIRVTWKKKKKKYSYYKTLKNKIENK